MTMMLEVLRTPLGAPHAFSTRLGGVSTGVYQSLNLGLSTGDKKTNVMQNRERFLHAFGTDINHVSVLSQVHSARVVTASAGWYEHEADAHMTDNPALTLVINTADCVPILFYDPLKHVVAAAHAGWRGTVAGIATKTVQALTKTYGSDAKHLHVAIGPCIQGACYQVGHEVMQAFKDAAFPEKYYPPDDEGRYRLDLRGANQYCLAQAGVQSHNIYNAAYCTHCDATRFYSHRRDGLKRGSHWSVIRIPEE